jgi:hypothetical protein
MNVWVYMASAFSITNLIGLFDSARDHWQTCCHAEAYHCAAGYQQTRYAPLIAYATVATLMLRYYPKTILATRERSHCRRTLDKTK